MYPHNHFSCKSATCLSPAAKSCSVLSQIGSCLNQVELLLFHLGYIFTLQDWHWPVDIGSRFISHQYMHKTFQSETCDQNSNSFPQENKTKQKTDKQKTSQNKTKKQPTKNQKK